MEFKIWGRLDDNGRIQSIQSNCSGLNHDLGSLPNSCSDSLLTINEKKKLVYQLDAKTDEMSLLIVQLSEMSKRLELQEKLLSEYETKFKRQQQELEQLRRENSLLRNNGGRDSRVKEEAGVSEPLNFSQPVTTFEMTCNLRCRPLKYSSCPTIVTNELGETDQSTSSGSYSTQTSFSGSDNTSSEESSSVPQRLRLDTIDGAIGSAPLESKTDDNVLNKSTIPPKVLFETKEPCNQTDESKLLSWDGYVLAANDDKLAIHQTATVANSNDTTFCTENKIKGDLNQNFRNADSALFGEGFNLDESDLEEKTDLKSQLYPPAPHSSSSDSCLSGSLEKDKDGYLILGNSEVRQIAQEEIHGTWLSVNLKIQQSQFRTSDGFDDVDGVFAQDRSTESEKDTCSAASGIKEMPSFLNKFKPKSTHSYAEIDETLLDPMFQHKRNSEPTNVYLPSKEEKRSLNSERLEDDVCNSCIKTMKTTMEWAKAKKGLLKESHEMTVERVESMLRDVVQEIYCTLQRYESEKPYRIKKSVAEKAVAVQRKLRHSRNADIISDDFLRKCVMVCSNKAP